MPGIVKITEKKKIRTLTVPDFKNYYKAVVTKTTWKKMGKCSNGNKIDSLEINPCMYEKLIFDKDAKAMR